MLFDSHFHLPSMASRGEDTTLPQEFLGLECGTIHSDAEERILLVGKRKDVYLSMGDGPWALDRDDWKGVKEAMKALRNVIALYGADAIGECGFDNHWAYGTKKEQMDLFLSQAELAKELDIPLIIHSRDADQELLETLPHLGTKTIMHCFSSGPEIAEKMLEKGAYLSFAGNVTYKANSHIQESARLCPLDRILFETDSPYLSPVPLRGRPCRPEYTEHTLSFLSALKEEEREKIKESAISNFLSLFENRESVVKRDIVSLEG